MRGQVTLEYMLFVLLGLSLLSISVVSLYKILENAESAAKRLEFAKFADQTTSFADDVCIMGSGSTIVFSPQFPVSIVSDGSAVVFSSGEMRTVRSFSCALKESAEISGNFLIKNEDGKIVFR